MIMIIMMINNDENNNDNNSNNSSNESRNNVTYRIIDIPARVPEQISSFFTCFVQ